MKMDMESRKIYDEKKAVLASGDEGFLKQVGEGKDIISILRESTPFCHPNHVGACITGITVRSNGDASDEDRLTEEEVLGQMS